MCVGNRKKEVNGNQRRRCRLWELDDYLCSVIGTCLSVKELKKLGRKMEMNIDFAISAYELHALFVHKAGEVDNDSKLIEKRLNHKFQLSI